jgi:predicted ester cyclase
MSDNKALLRNFFDTMNTGSLEAVEAAIDQGYAENIVYHGMGDELSGRDGMKALVGGYMTAFPDMKISVESQVEEGDMLVTRFVAQGINTGEFQGQPPTGKPVRMQLISMTRIVDGQIIEEWEEGDLLGLLKQLGLAS